MTTPTRSRRTALGSTNYLVCGGSTMHSLRHERASVLRCPSLAVRSAGRFCWAQSARRRGRLPRGRSERCARHRSAGASRREQRVHPRRGERMREPAPQAESARGEAVDRRVGVEPRDQGQLLGLRGRLRPLMQPAGDADPEPTGMDRTTSRSELSGTAAQPARGATTSRTVASRRSRRIGIVSAPVQRALQVPARVAPTPGTSRGGPAAAGCW